MHKKFFTSAAAGLILALAGFTAAPVTSASYSAVVAGPTSTGTFTAAEQKSPVTLVRKGEKLNVVLVRVSAAFTGSIRLERGQGNVSWSAIKSYTSAINDTIQSGYDTDIFVRLRVNAIGVADTVTYSIGTVTASITMYNLETPDGISVFKITNEGIVSPKLTATTVVGALTGLADSATGAFRAQRLTTARTIGGTSFNGTANIVPAFADSSTGSTRAPAGALTGATLAAGVTASSLTSLGTVTSLTTAGLIDASGAGAGQLKFPATQNASGDANTLDDYEEASWSPTLVNWTNTGTPTVTGTYTKIGRTVFITILVVPATNVSSIAGTSTVENLPFTPAQGASSIAGSANSGISYGTGTVLTNGKLFPPTTGVITSNLIITSWYNF